MRSKSSLTPTPPALSRPQPPRYARLLARYEPFVGSKTECFPRSQGTCFVVPPPGETNGNGETAEQALAECQARCNRNPNRCRAVVVVPVAKPAAVAFQVRCLPPRHPPAPLPASLLTTRPLLLTTTPQHPLFNTHSLSFPQEGATRAPWGQGNCLDACFENEHPGSQVSYGVGFGLDEPQG